MRVHYINLDRRKDRNDRFLAFNGDLVECVRASAVEGKSLLIDQLIKDGILQQPIKSFTEGSLGAAVSHKKLWDECIANGTNFTVAEDDAVLNHDFAAKAETFLAKLPAQWDIVLWAWNFDTTLCVRIMDGLSKATMSFDIKKLGRAVHSFQEKDITPNPYSLLGAFGVACYTLSPRGAERLRSFCFPLKNELINVPGFKRPLPPLNIDTTMNKYYGNLNAFVSFPPLAWTENDAVDSDNLNR